LLLFFISRRPPPARLLPYTTLFRSQPRGFQASIGGFFNTVAAVVTREIPVPKDDEDMEPEMRTVRALVTSPIPGEAEVTKNPQGLLPPIIEIGDETLADIFDMIARGETE